MSLIHIKPWLRQENAGGMCWFYTKAFNSQGNSRCQISQSDHCAGVFSQMDIINSSHHMTTELFGTLYLPDEYWMVGSAINFANNTQLVDN